MLEVLAQPPMKAALAPYSAAQGPWARREPNSLTGRLPAARVTRDAFVAMAIWWFMMQSRGVSRTWASMIGPTMVRMGSLGKAISPSFMAYTLPVNFMWARYSRNSR